MKSIFLAFLLLIFPDTVHSHPGRTTQDGCHTCLNDCAKWEVPQGEEHCHNAKDDKYRKDKVDRKTEKDDKNKVSESEPGAQSQEESKSDVKPDVKSMDFSGSAFVINENGKIKENESCREFKEFNNAHTLKICKFKGSIATCKGMVESYRIFRFSTSDDCETGLSAVRFGK